MAITNFKPAIWSKAILVELEGQSVWTQPGVANRSYEGEIAAFGDRVKINGLGAVTVGTYTANTDITAPEALTDNTRSLVIDQAKYVNFQVDDIDRRQSNVDLLQAGAAEAARGLRKVAEAFVAGKAVAGADAGNVLGSSGTPIDVSADGAAYDQLVALEVKLDEADVPADGRWVIASPAFVANLTKDKRWSTVGSEDTLRKGFAGFAAGFTVLKSTYAATGAVVAGYGEAIAFAEQIPTSSLEAYRPEKRFGTAIKGLHLYGAQVVRPEALAVLYWTD